MCKVHLAAGVYQPVWMLQSSTSQSAGLRQQYSTTLRHEQPHSFTEERSACMMAPHSASCLCPHHPVCLYKLQVQTRQQYRPTSMQADTLVLPLLLSLSPIVSAAPQERLGNVLETAGLNSVPMMGRKRAPIDLPSFTSGFLPPKYPKYMRVRTNKRGEDGEEKKTSLAATWASILGSRPASMYNNVPGKRRPWTSSWANIMVKPASLYQKSPGKRTAVPSDWGSGYDNLLRSPQGFRFHSGGQDYLARDLLFKRAKEVVRPLPEKNDEAEKEKKSEDAAGPKTKKDAEPSVAATTEEESHENGVETSFEPFNNQWVENFESLMADASLVRTLLPSFILSACFHASS